MQFIHYPPCKLLLLDMFFMARRAIPMIAFHGVESIYIFSCVHLREYAVVKKVVSFPGGPVN